MAESDVPLPRVAWSRGYGARYPHRGHYAGNVVFGLVAFIGSCLAIHAIRPFPDIPKLAPKLRYFTAHKDEFDTIFVGSSHFYRGVVPKVFDGVTKAAAALTHSFNFGLDGLQPPESVYFLNQLLGLKPAHLKWIFLELEEVQGQWPKERWETQRFYYWHNWHFTRAAIESVIDPGHELPWWGQLSRAVQSETARLHFLVFCKNMGNLGAARNLWERLMGGSKASAGKKFSDEQGFMEQPFIMPADRAEVYVKELERQGQDREQRPVNAVTEEIFRETNESIEATGASPVYVLAPGQSQTGLRFHAADRELAPILAFNNSQKYSELYDLKFRADEHHLTLEGAKLFTRLLAEQFVREIAATK